MKPADDSDLEPVYPREKLGKKLLAWAQWIFWTLAAGLFLIPPWAFGGMGPEGYFLIVWAGRLCVLPLVLWLASRAVLRRPPRASFWIAVACWGGLAWQINASIQNRSHVPQPPWVGYDFIPVPYNPSAPSTAFRGGTQQEAHLWLAFGLLALTARFVGQRSRQLRILLWIFVVNTTVLAAVGIPFKYSGEMKILGKWPAPEWYFYSTFLYHNHWCAFALLAVAAAVALIESYRNRWVRRCLLMAAATMAASAPLSTSRLGTLAMIVFAGVALWLSWRWRKRVRLGRSPTSEGHLGMFAAALLGFGLIAGGAFFMFRTHGEPGGHRSWTKILNSNPFGIRQMIFEDTIPMIAEKPWFGWGLGAYGAGFRAFQRPETKIVQNGGRVTLYDHSHNDWLERLAELGVVGMSLFLIPPIGWVILRLRRRAPMSAADRWVFTGCIGLLIFALGDMAFANRMVFAAIVVLFPLSLQIRIFPIPEPINLNGISKITHSR